jgi:cbb3-type cytochrome oxidase maturation protein
LTVGIWLLLIPISALLMVAAGIAFLWAVDTDQFEGLDRHGFDILEDIPGDKR